MKMLTRNSRDLNFGFPLEQWFRICRVLTKTNVSSKHWL